MIKIPTLIPLLTILFGTAACSHIDMESTTFYQQKPDENVPVHVVAVDDAMASSLAFQHYRALIEEQLKQQGFSIVDQQQAARRKREEHHRNNRLCRQRLLRRR